MLLTFIKSINKTFREYLVNYPLLVRMMENYGFIPITDEEAVQMGMLNKVRCLTDCMNI
jgi:hypothetical protein